MKIKKQDIKTLLREAAKGRDTYVPQKNIGGDIWIEPLPKEKKNLEEPLDRIVLEDRWVVIPPKDIFFPQLEVMFEFKGGRIKEIIESQPKLLFGIKACDLKGILFVDDFFKRNFEDKYYLSRNQNRIIVVIGCLMPPRREACFCTSTKTGPFAETGFDLQLVDSGDSYLIEVGSKKGEEFISTFRDFFKDSSINEKEKIKEIKQKACNSIELKIDFQKALELMANNSFEPQENYKRIAQKCIYCSACIYVCPTCTCFNVFDYIKDKEGSRFRNWDSCIFEGYTREASGHNPRGDKWVRTKRRYEHKLRYDYKTTGMSGCVGCGRCLASCPVSLGMSKFIQEITQL